jgi:hypothetical protein
VLVAIGWAGRPIGPVDLALLLGGYDGAKALAKAGAPWSCHDFLELSRALETLDGAVNDYNQPPYKNAPLAQACQRARALAERLVLEQDVNGAIRKGEPSRM